MAVQDCLCHRGEGSVPVVKLHGFADGYRSDPCVVAWREASVEPSNTSHIM